MNTADTEISIQFQAQQSTYKTAYSPMPDQQHSINHPVFKIGLTSAGAVSAGAYTAGVMDFMLQALHEWHQHRTNCHTVQIQALSGASAGGICSALVIPWLFRNSKEFGNKSIFYQCWVQGISIEKLLDIPEQSKDSLLNAQHIHDIANQFISNPSTNQSGQKYNSLPAYINPDLQLFLTLTNLNGYAYGITVDKHSIKPDYIMRNHSDYDAFTLSESAPNGFTRINQHQGWEQLRRATLATSAFPLALEAKNISILDNQANRIAKHFAERHTLPKDIVIEDYGRREFLCADGGMTNNEPFTLVHDALAGGAGIYNQRESDKADRSVIMIDPFPDTGNTLDFKEIQTGLTAIPAAIFNALLSQSRFKKQDLLLAFDEHIFSRFLIAPSRNKQDNSELSLAGAVLSSFGGFLSQEFREHDYQLGRRNCQRFLAKRFILSPDNPLFAHWSADLRKQYLIIEDGKEYLPIIPLCGSAAEKVKRPDWPQIRQQEIDALQPLLRNRLLFLIRSISKEKRAGIVWRILIFLLASCVAGTISKKVCNFIITELKKNGLMRG
jgi:hypothetical protein